MTAGEEFARLVDIMRRLRTECPWDRSQNHDTLRPYLLEEAYEVLHALDDERYDDLLEELGDLMLQIVFHAEIAEESGRFDVADVLRHVNEKLTRRHPHVFGDKTAQTPADVFHRWESIKKHDEQRASSLDGVPAELPALVKASRMLAKVRQTGADPFQGKNVEEVARRWLEMLASSAQQGSEEDAARAAGMLALAMTEIAGQARANTEDALRQTLKRLEDAFRREESRLKEAGRTFDDASEEELAQIAARILADCEET
ncbi:MAG: nucleoside triphosphate pyrophosphohydrolase [Planctomycetota bacterium]|jgi:MazG family protein